MNLYSVGSNYFHLLSTSTLSPVFMLLSHRPRRQTLGDNSVVGTRSPLVFLRLGGKQGLHLTVTDDDFRKAERIFSRCPSIHKS